MQAQPREDARGDSGEQSGGGASAVAFEQELVFECVDDRLDPLPDPADRRVGPVRLVGSAWSQQQGSQLADGRFEVGAGEPFVTDDRCAFDRVGLEQFECRLALGALAATRSKWTIVPSGAQRSTSLKPQ